MHDAEQLKSLKFLISYIKLASSEEEVKRLCDMVDVAKTNTYKNFIIKVLKKENK